jgi:hypothetical protein
MKLSTLLSHRRTLQRHARLAAVAFTYWKLGELAERVARARICGEVHLTRAAPESEQWAAPLMALEGNQSVIEEHFTDEDVLDFADAAAVTVEEGHLDLTFRIEEIEREFREPLRRRLEESGVAIDRDFAGEARRQVS